MRIEHIAMYVTDLERAKDFFVKYFNAKANKGYHNKKTDFRSYFLSFEDGAHNASSHGTALHRARIAYGSLATVSRYARAISSPQDHSFGLVQEHQSQMTDK